jgi:hypothetical protein
LPPCRFIVILRHQHRRQTRIVTQRRHFLPAGTAVALQRAQRLQQPFCRRQVNRGRRSSQFSCAGSGIPTAAAPSAGRTDRFAKSRLALRRRAFRLLFGKCRQIPGSRRPRPARWVIDAWLMRCVISRVSPVRASKRHALLGAIHHQADAFDG